MKNKKLLLVATAALGLVAVATAGVGTAAWYAAQSKAGVTVQNDSFTISTQAYSESIGGVKFTAAITETSVNLQLSNASGKTGYIAGGVAKTVDAVDACYSVLTVTVTAAKDGESDLSLAQLLTNVYDNVGSHQITVRATPAGQALVKWDADGTLNSSEKTALYSASLTTADDTAIALSSTGATTSWTLYVAVADRAVHEDTTPDTAGEHSSDAVTVTPVAPY